MNCPSCFSTDFKRNGHIHNGKQNYMCHPCGRQFVENPTKKLISSRDKELIDKLLLEKISLAGIARTLDVSEVWLQGYIADLYASQPDDLNAELPTADSMEAHLSDKLDSYIYEVGVYEKTLCRLSLRLHGRILKHLSPI
jgi:hypothetical protein